MNCPIQTLLSNGVIRKSS